MPNVESESPCSDSVRPKKTVFFFEKNVLTMADLLQERCEMDGGADLFWLGWWVGLEATLWSREKTSKSLATKYCQMSNEKGRLGDEILPRYCMWGFFLINHEIRIPII